MSALYFFEIGSTNVLKIFEFCYNEWETELHFRKNVIVKCRLFDQGKEALL